MSLSLRQLSTVYSTQGFVHPVSVLTDDEVEGHYSRLLDYERRFGSMHYRVKPYLIFSSAYEIATHPVLLDAVEHILGPDILLWDSSYVIKEPKSEGFISWHQDLKYWGLECDRDDDVLSVWIALTDAYRANGCMQFVVGSHQGPHLDHNDTYDENNLLHRGQSIQAEFNQDEIIHIELKAGACSFHHGWAIHSSNPNHSDTRRVALTINYVRPSVRQVVGKGETATLVRGQDAHQNFGKEPMCGYDNVEENTKFQQDAERKKREVYDSA